MSYRYLGQDLHETADRAKKWFAKHGATSFKCEETLHNEMSLLPTWQARLKAGYTLCVNVQSRPFTPTIASAVVQGAQLGLPVKLWVAVDQGSATKTFAADLKSAQQLGVGVIGISNTSEPHEYLRAVPLSLFGLNKTDLDTVPKSRREVIKNAEDTYLYGSPDAGCQAICQELELVTRQIAHATYGLGQWKTPAGASTLTNKFFLEDSWAIMLEAFEARLEIAMVAAKSPTMKKQLIVRTRAFTDWRNSVSHKPKTLAQVKARDARLRTMFEATRDLLVEWYVVAKPMGLLH